jgi:hypothetical protein
MQLIAIFVFYKSIRRESSLHQLSACKWQQKHQGFVAQLLIFCAYAGPKVRKQFFVEFRF